MSRRSAGGAHMAPDSANILVKSTPAVISIEPLFPDKPPADNDGRGTTLAYHIGTCDSIMKHRRGSKANEWHWVLNGNTPTRGRPQLGQTYAEIARRTLYVDFGSQALADEYKAVAAKEGLSEALHRLAHSSIDGPQLDAVVATLLDVYA